MKHHFSTFGLIAIATTCSAQNNAPQLSNVQYNIPWASGQLHLTYDLSDTENDAAAVQLLVSNDGGQSYLVNVGTMTGDVGVGITNGTGKQITWDFDTISNIYAYSLRLVADDGQLPSVQEIVDQVDSVNIRTDLEFVAGIRHYITDTVHLEEVKDFIEQRFLDGALQARRQLFLRDNYTGHNIIGRKQGLGDEASTYIIDAHFDGVNYTPGADDNGSGVVAFLEALRVLAPYNFTKSINFIGFDFEETVGIGGLYGSQMYVQDGRLPFEDIQGVINFETMGYYSDVPNSQQIPTGFGTIFPDQVAALAADQNRGNFIVNAGDTESEDLANAFANAALTYVPALKVTTLIVPFNGAIALDLRRSDHAHFWDLDIPALLITDGANLRNPNYHNPTDTIGSLNFTFMERTTKAAVATLIEWAGLQNSSFVDVEILGSGIPQATGGCNALIFPNPSTGIFSLKTDACFSSSSKVEVYTVDGRLLTTRNVTAQNERINFDLQGLACGTYQIRISDKANSMMKKVVIH